MEKPVLGSLNKAFTGVALRSSQVGKEGTWGNLVQDNNVSDPKCHLLSSLPEDGEKIV